VISKNSLKWLQNEFVSKVTGSSTPPIIRIKEYMEQAEHLYVLLA
jgi:hypothetical protein